MNQTIAKLRRVRLTRLGKRTIASTIVAVLVYVLNASFALFPYFGLPEATNTYVATISAIIYFIATQKFLKKLDVENNVRRCNNMIGTVLGIHMLVLMAGSITFAESLDNIFKAVIGGVITCNLIATICALIFIIFPVDLGKE